MSDKNDNDSKWDEWFDKREKQGMVVMSRDELRELLDTVATAAATEAYAVGRQDEREQWQPVLETLQKVRDEGCIPDGFELLLRNIDTVIDKFNE